MKKKKKKKKNLFEIFLSARVTKLKMICKDIIVMSLTGAKVHVLHGHFNSIFHCLLLEEMAYLTGTTFNFQSIVYN